MPYDNTNCRQIEWTDYMGRVKQGTISQYIEQSLDNSCYYQGELETINSKISDIASKFSEFIEMLVEEEIVTLEQIQKVF